MIDNPKVVILASGIDATVLILRPKAASIDRGFLQTPSKAEVRAAQILHEARIEQALTPVPGPHVPLAVPETVNHPKLGSLDVFSTRGKAALAAAGPTQAPLFLLRGQATDLDAQSLIANANYFLFQTPDLDAPWNAYGDPIGLVLSGGEIFYAPQLPRACLLWADGVGSVQPLAFSDVDIRLPTGANVRPHPFGTPTSVNPGTAYARYFGAQDGCSPAGDGYDVVYIGKYPAAGGPAGGLPIPRSGSIVRFESRDAAIGALGPLQFRLSEQWQEGVQAGPQILAEGALTGAGVFTREHMTETPALPEPGTVSPANWRADWDETRAARLGAGVTEDGTLVFMAVEGTSSSLSGAPKASGATLRDLAHLMRDQGCLAALHLDGGGSTQVFGQAGGALIAPTDVHHGLPDRQSRYDRPVPTWLSLRF